MQGISAYWVILAGRLVQGIGAAGAFPIVIPFVGDLFKDEKEVTLLWYAPFISIPILCLISFLLVVLFVKEPKKDASDQQNLQVFITKIKDILHEKGRWLYAIFVVGGISMFIIFGILFFCRRPLSPNSTCMELQKDSFWPFRWPRSVWPLMEAGR